MIGWIIGSIISGGIIGALARLIVPGKENLSIWQTIGIGIASSVVATFLLAWLLPGFLVWIASVLAAAGFIYWWSNRNQVM